MTLSVISEFYISVDSGDTYDEYHIEFYDIWCRINPLIRANMRLTSLLGAIKTSRQTIYPRYLHITNKDPRDSTLGIPFDA